MSKKHHGSPGGFFLFNTGEGHEMNEHLGFLVVKGPGGMTT